MDFKKQLFVGGLRKRCSGNMQHIYRRTPIPKCDFNKVAKQFYQLQRNFIEIALRHGCSLVNLLHILRTPFYGSTYGGWLLDFVYIFILSEKHLCQTSLSLLCKLILVVRLIMEKINSLHNCETMWKSFIIIFAPIA